MATSTQSLPGSSGAFEEATYRKVSWRLVPLLLLCYVVAYLDRVNVGFAKLQMASDLNLSDTVYGPAPGSSSVISSSRCRATSSCTGSARACGSRGSWRRGA